MASDCLLVAAIDFGTTFSGYAFSLRHDYDRDPLKVCANTWSGGQFMSLKTSTCALFKPSGDFHSFGFEAEDKYSELSEEGEHKDWYYFRRFKMKLYENKALSRGFLIEDDKGKTMTALKVISCSIKYLKDHMVSMCKNQVTTIDESDIQFILTVPAIWSDASKQFMREAAEEGGITGKHLKLCLEPEAASLFCKHLPLEKRGSGQFESFAPGTKYMVLDAGGGTIDITVHKVRADGSLKEIHMANGGDWGGTKVDDAFVNLLTDMTGTDIFKQFSDNNKADILDILRDFEVKKRALKADGDARVTFKIPSSLNETCKSATSKDMKSLLESKHKFSSQMTMFGDKIRFNASLARRLFEDSSIRIIQHMKELLNHPSAKDVSSILMVGGFSESPILQQSVRTAFPQKKVIVPQDAGLAVLKGAVIFGHEPCTITKRICKFTYGVKVAPHFDPKVHPESKRYIDRDGMERCVDVFSRYVTIGETVIVGQAQKPKRFVPNTKNQTMLDLKVYASTEKKPIFVTDPSCSLLGSLVASVPDASDGRDRGVLVHMTFSGTELEVTATKIYNGVKVEAWFDFL